MWNKSHFKQGISCWDSFYRRLDPNDLTINVIFFSSYLHSFVQLLIVFISEPPSIANKIAPRTVFTGDSFILNCSANGYPTPVVRWFKDGSLIYQNTSLAFPSLNQSDTGLYMCNASNIAGSDTYEVQLVVRGRESVAKVRSRLNSLLF